LIVLLRTAAEAQLSALPEPASRKVRRALRVLAAVPHSGRPFPDDSPYAGLMWKTVRVRRGWSYRIVYGIGHRRIQVHFIVPTWFVPPGAQGTHD
jgi:hypothetical protein